MDRESSIKERGVYHNYERKKSGKHTEKRERIYKITSNQITTKSTMTFTRREVEKGQSRSAWWWMK